MKTFLLTILFFCTSVPIQANDRVLGHSFCQWLGNAAISIVNNRDNGMDEYDLIEEYLEQTQSYIEQSVIIPLIDRIYGIEPGIDTEDIAFVERQQCLVSLAQYAVQDS